MKTAMIFDSVLISVSIVHAFLLNACMSFTIQPIPNLNPSQRDNDIASKNHDRSHQSFYRHTQMKGGGVSEPGFPNKSYNRTGIDTSLFFADESCYDLCELVEDELKDNFLPSDQPTPEMKQDDSIADIYSGNGVVTSSDSVSSPSSSSSLSININEKSVEKVMSNIELRWNIDESEDGCDPEDASTCSDICDACGGKGVVDCHFCGGTGWIDFGDQIPGTMGEKLVERNGGVQGTECPVCNDDCEQTCQKCMGSGWIARWRMKNFSNDL